MHVLKTSLVTTSEEFKRHHTHYESRVADLKKHLATRRPADRPTRSPSIRNAAN